MSAEGHRLVLTGASGGLGQAFALALAPKCRAMVLCGRDSVRLQVLQQKLRALHPGLDIRTVAGDLLDPSIQSAVGRSAGELDAPIDLLINAAGINEFVEFEQQTAENMMRLMTINLLVPMQLAQRLLPLLKQAPQAQIINIGSIFGYLGYPGFAVYCATKFGLRGYSQALRRELSDTRVSVRYFAPRAVSTPLNSPAVQQMNRALKTAEDSPGSVADELVKFIAARSWDRRLGFPEKLYVWLNQILPAVNDNAIRGQLPVIRKHLGQASAPQAHTERRTP
jgi:short-subunit dehydrogenase